MTRQNHYTTVPLSVVAATSLLHTPKQLTAGRCCTKLVIIETHDPAMTNHFMNDMTDSIQVPSTFQHSLEVLAHIAEGCVSAHCPSECKCMTFSRLVSAGLHSNVRIVDQQPVCEFLQVASEITGAMKATMKHCQLEEANPALTTWINMVPQGVLAAPSSHMRCVNLMCDENTSGPVRTQAIIEASPQVVTALAREPSGAPSA